MAACCTTFFFPMLLIFVTQAAAASYYDLMGVETTASTHDIKRAFRRLGLLAYLLIFCSTCLFWIFFVGTSNVLQPSYTLFAPAALKYHPDKSPDEDAEEK